MAQDVVVSEDPRVTRTRELIERSFYELLMEKSLHTLTVGEIAQRARINRATFYAHFEDKYALYRHTVRSTFNRILQENLTGLHGDGRAELKALVRSACVFFEQLHAACPPADRQTRPLVEVQVQSELSEYLLVWIQTYVMEPDDLVASPEIMAKMAGWAIFGAGLDWERSRQAVDVLATQIHAVVARMLGCSCETC